MIDLSKAIVLSMNRTTFATLLAAALLCSCGSPEPQEEAAPDTDAASTPAPAPEVALPPRKPSPEGARVWFVSPGDGAALTSPFTVEFGLEGMELLPAGEIGEHTGHHHLLVNTPLPRMDLPIITDDAHMHFGLAQTSVEMSLAPGTHTLQLLLGDDLHIPHDPPVMSEVITVEVTD